MPQGAFGGQQVGWTERPGSGRRLLFLHCTLAAGVAWKGVIAALGEGPDCLAPDLPGHGASDFDPARGLLAQAVDGIAGLMDRQGGARHVVGHSLGAVVALRLALEQPDLVSSLTLYEPVLFGLLYDVGHPRWAAEVVERDALGRSFVRGDEAATRHFLSRWGDPAAFDAMRPDQRAGLVARVPIVPHSDAALFGDGPERIFADDLRRITVPVCLIAGEHSAPTFDPILDVIADRTDCRARHTLPGVGHVGPMSHPAQVADAIRSFLIP